MDEWNSKWDLVEKRIVELEEKFEEVNLDFSIELWRESKYKKKGV